MIFKFKVGDIAIFLLVIFRNGNGIFIYINFKTVERCSQSLAALLYITFFNRPKFVKCIACIFRMNNIIVFIFGEKSFCNVKARFFNDFNITAYLLIGTDSESKVTGVSRIKENFINIRFAVTAVIN